MIAFSYRSIFAGKKNYYEGESYEFCQNQEESSNNVTGNRDDDVGIPDRCLRCCGI